MSSLDDKQKYPILLLERHIDDAQLISEWIKELGHLTHISNINNFKTVISQKTWNLIIAVLDSNETENQNILNIIKEASSSILILIVTSIKIDENILKNELPHNFVILYKPFSKDVFLDAFFSLTGPSLDRRRKTDRRKYKQKIILFIGAHPDDVEIGSGGCMARHFTQGDSINILTLSSGGSGGHFATRREEAKKAAEIFHANLFLKDLTDTEISHVDTINLIDEVVQQIEPTHVYTHSIHDVHQDHRNVHHASIVACRGVPNLYCYLSPSTSIYFKPNLFVEITNYIDKKLEVLAVYKSQVSKRPYLQEDMIRATARYWGRYSNYGLAEPMEIMRQTEVLF